MRQDEIQVHKPANIKVVVVDFHESAEKSSELCELAESVDVDVFSVLEERNEFDVYSVGGYTVSIIGNGPLAYAISRQRE